MTNEIVIYKPNEQFQLEVQLKDETVWLTQQQIADLFGVKRPAVTKHLGNIFHNGELDAYSVGSILEHTAADTHSRIWDRNSPPSRFWALMQKTY